MPYALLSPEPTIHVDNQSPDYIRENLQYIRMPNSLLTPHQGFSKSYLHNLLPCDIHWNRNQHAKHQSDLQN